MSCVLILDSNLMDQRLSYTKSSEQTAYPASNALDLNRRKKTWRSAGNWVIAGGSNTLVIRDAVAGADLTATVAPGTYASDALFFAALKTALEAASDSTFTISRDLTTNAIKITAVLGGAATAFLIRGAAAGSANFAPIIGFALTNLSGSLSYVADVLKIHTSEWFIFDLGFSVSPTAFMGVADRNKPIRISPTASVRLQGNATNIWTAPQVDVAVTIGDFGIAYADSAGIGGIACRYWRVVFTDPSNPYGYVELGAMLLATHTTLTRGAVDFPMGVQNIDLSQQDYSEGGQLTSTPRPQSTMPSLEWNGLDPQSYENVLAVFETYGTHSVFGAILDGEDAFSTSIMKWAKLFRFASPPRDNLVSSGNWSVAWTLREDL